WRWLCEADAGLDRRELSRVGEAIFAYLDELAAACAQGYAEARVQAAGDRQRRLLAAIVSDPPPRAAIGPSVPLAGAAMSLRWARHALALARAGVVPAGPVRCDQHLSTLLILADEDLAAALCGRRLAPLARLRPGQRDRIAETLLAWLQLGENAAEVAQRIHVHPQTVRYRMRQIHELFGDQLRDPDRRFELQLALRIRTLAGRRESG
ncbi:MAG TPA: helix-turn-helix domain-containing protein, partial [Streptosporangiaceae bacterium]